MRKHAVSLPADYARCNGVIGVSVCDRRERCARFTSVPLIPCNRVDWACRDTVDHFIDNAPEETL